MTYFSEVWLLKEKAEQMLPGAEMDFWRKSAGNNVDSYFIPNCVP